MIKNTLFAALIVLSAASAACVDDPTPTPTSSTADVGSHPDSTLPSTDPNQIADTDHHIDGTLAQLCRADAAEFCVATPDLGCLIARYTTCIGG